MPTPSGLSFVAVCGTEKARKEASPLSKWLARVFRWAILNIFIGDIIAIAIDFVGDDFFVNEVRPLGHL
jgi:hypothetical protein